MSAAESTGNFDPALYISYYYPNSVKPHLMTQFLIRRIVKFCEENAFPPNSMKVLDYGNGPTPACDLPFSSIASEIVLAEYEEGNRNYVKKWLSNQPDCHDWSFYLKYVAELQGGEQQPDCLEEKFKGKVKAVVSCDITTNPFIDEGYEGPYDIVLSSMCIESACRNDQDYKEALTKLGSLVNTDGYLLLFSTIREKSDIGFYTVNNVKLYDYAVKKRKVLKFSEECGLQLLQEEDFQDVPPSDENTNLEFTTLFIFKKIN